MDGRVNSMWDRDERRLIPITRYNIRRLRHERTIDMDELPGYVGWYLLSIVFVSHDNVTRNCDEWSIVWSGIGSSARRSG